jgi:hypothetical protein
MCAEPLNAVIGKPVENLSQYRDGTHYISLRKVKGTLKDTSIESFPTEDVVPIAVLSLFPISSTLPPIRARVTYKSRLRDPYHSRWHRPSFVIHLMDESSEIRAEVEGWLTEFAEEIYDRLQEGKIYYLSNLNLVDTGGYFDTVNFSNLKNETLLSLTRATIIEEVCVYV